MKDLDQPWDLNQTWPVGGKWCRFTNVPKNFGAALPKFGAQKRQILDHFFATCALDTALRHISGTKRRIDKQKY